MLQPTTDHWRTTSYKCKDLVRALGHALGKPGLVGATHLNGRHEFFVGYVPRRCGAQRPQFPRVWLVRFRGHCVLACCHEQDHQLVALAQELAALPVL